MPAMASLRTRTRSNGSEYFAVLYRRDGKQTSTSFEDFPSASKFCDLVTKFGVENALATLSVDESVLTAVTVRQWCEHHVDHLTGVDQNTVAKYQAYIRNDIGPALGDLPLKALTKQQVKAWVKSMEQPKADGKKLGAKTIRNKVYFLAGALNTAVPKHIDENPCHDIRLPDADDEGHEMLCLSREQFALLLSRVTPHWRPMVEFLVASGARWGEVAALRPSDVDRQEGTVRIARSWKHGPGGYRLGATKTVKGVRTIDVPASVLDKLDYSHEFLFVNRDGGPVRSHGFIRRVWAPALSKAWPSVDSDGKPITNPVPLRPRIHDLRHTCASWMIQAAVPLPVIQEHLGHESIQTTVAVYGHLDRRSKKIAADVIGAALAG